MSSPFVGWDTLGFEEFWDKSKRGQRDRWEWYRGLFRSSLNELDIKLFKSWYLVRGIPLWGGNWYNENDKKTHFDKINTFLIENKEERWREILKEDMSFYSDPDHSQAEDVNGINTEHSRVRYFFHWSTLYEHGIDAKNLDYIFEFGGGVGHVPKLVKQLGFGGTYTIYDLPELSIIQNYYNNMEIKTISDPCLLDVLQIPRGKNLFYSTWALSESPIDIREKIENHFDKFDLFLILYQAEYTTVGKNEEEIIDNDKYFGDLMKRTAGINWKVVEHPNGWDGGSKYIIGVRQKKAAEIGPAASDF